MKTKNLNYNIGVYSYGTETTPFKEETLYLNNAQTKAFKRSKKFKTCTYFKKQTEIIISIKVKL